MNDIIYTLNHNYVRTRGIIIVYLIGTCIAL